MDPTVSRTKPTSAASRPIATATIEPVGARSTPRAHVLRLDLPLGSHAERQAVVGCAEEALRTLEPATAPSYSDVIARDKVVGIQAALAIADTPDIDALGRMRQSLADAGYHVTVRVVRECADAGCTTTSSAELKWSAAVPSGWHSATICGKHGYRACGTCGSLYVMMSSSGGGPTRAVHCVVCEAVLVEWGATKMWTAELVTRGRRP
jgi:hypothetical protein